jgi:hypothetical protein
MECPKPRGVFEFGPDSSGGYSDWFGTTQISVDGIHFDTKPEGYFYLPNVIIFYDRNDFSFPSLYYFIAQIGDRLEIRSVEGGENVKWHHTADLHRPVDDASIIRKIETSLEDLIAFLKDYKEPEKPKAPPVKGASLASRKVEKLISLFDMPGFHAPKIVYMAKSPFDYFEANENTLRDYQIFSPSEDMYLWYLLGILEEGGKIGIVDWKAEYSDVVSTLNAMGDFKLEEHDGSRHERSTSEEILLTLNNKIESSFGKIIFCIDSDSCSFGVTDKIRLRKLISTGKKLGIKIYQPKK